MWSKVLVYRIHQNLSMVLFTPKKLTFKGSKKQYQILAQTAYYQAGKIVVQTILPEQPPVALITLNTLGTTCSTSADTYIPIENIFNTQSCSFLESRLISLYGGKAASLLTEYQQRNDYVNRSPLKLAVSALPLRTKFSYASNSNELSRHTSAALEGYSYQPYNTEVNIRNNVAPPKSASTNQRFSILVEHAQRVTNRRFVIRTGDKLRLPQKGMPSRGCLVRTCFAGTGNNIFQSTLGNIEIQTATRLARIMVNYWNFYSLNRTSLQCTTKMKNLRFVTGRTYPVKCTDFSGASMPIHFSKKGPTQLRYEPLRGLQQIIYRDRAAALKSADSSTKISSWARPSGNKSAICFASALRFVKSNFYFAIAQSNNSLKICENKNSSYNIQRLSIENIGNYSQLNNNNFQLINSLQFSNLQRDCFYPNWFRLYLPDMEATEFLKNVANYYFSLGLQTLTFPSTKSSYYFIPGFAFRKLEISTTNPFLIFLNKKTHKENYKLFIPTITSYTYSPPSILANATSNKSINSRIPVKISSLYWADQRSVAGFNATLVQQNKSQICYNESELRTQGYSSTKMQNRRADAKQIADLLPEGVKLQAGFSGGYRAFTPSELAVRGSRVPFKYPNRGNTLNVPFSLLLENQIFPLNCNGFSIVEKELLYNALVNSSFAKAFYLINQNRQLLDFLVDYLLRFQILRQHQILYLFSTLLLGCNKTVAYGLH